MNEFGFTCLDDDVHYDIDDKVMVMAAQCQQGIGNHSAADRLPSREI